MLVRIVLAFALQRACAVAPHSSFAAAPTPSPAASAEPDRIAMRMLRVEPSPDSTVDRKRPEISATFSETIDPKTIRLAVDGRDVTPDAFVSARSFVYEPSTDLPTGAHGISVSGMTPDREAFAERWTFASAEAQQATAINGLEPPNGTLVIAAFTVSGYAHPKAHVRLVVSTSETIASFADTTGGTSTIDVVADKRGYFEARIEPGERTGVVDVRIAATTADGALAVRTLRLRQ